MLFSNFLINCREWFINTFRKKILLIEKNKIIIDNKIVIFIINISYCGLIKYLLKYNQINIVYEVDELIFYEEYKINSIKINLILQNIILIDDTDNNKITQIYHNKEISILDKLNKYNKNVPVFIFMKLENIKETSKIKLFLNKNKKTIIIEHLLKDIMYKKLFQILNL